MATDDLVSLTTGFLRDLATGRIDEALSVVDENILYENVGLPTVRGMKRFTRAMHMLNGKFLHFDAEILNAAADGGVVLNERIDLLSIGPLRIRFWVCGRFEVVDGRIVVWRDYFDMVDSFKGLLRGIVGLVIPTAVKPIRSLTEPDDATESAAELRGA
ncbi:MAG TPA: limonene-1,2-epoxide hydrolase family protein [Gordonia sp. (in: high G+C Gram-positive bacteria)]|uniref:limonene-1,2-epoxide hydrolase family protein n=1 Tax=unclassified Gordonia (in: high G+C Gram-positive bacteria) TaxID=2657482 RepID=UPI000F995D00|nr:MULTISPECIES: limonene-1,2-epoxide hydrolase family protein [unclassified Gordonia (in: high G+C Gram-positive bacteria)]RUP37007.1 MAG: limonene-1,2-epoxide hydrolase [Gordonia sp. (in: high G+C Gram-positive bacteria)]HNP58927.1 limonene-1,2-epoxide hydrolase family protein [Gordonia sp. (in: high G+C Gram-positive bacteria)]HRC52616.1 limonene-1,2-epoxide hydrolase family protein [Gordonia sp. (in: high G+C Gram-positive bacteria)]